MHSECSITSVLTLTLLAPFMLQSSPGRSGFLNEECPSFTSNGKYLSLSSSWSFYKPGYPKRQHLKEQGRAPQCNREHECRVQFPRHQVIEIWCASLSLVPFFDLFPFNFSPSLFPCLLYICISFLFLWCFLDKFGHSLTPAVGKGN